METTHSPQFESLVQTWMRAYQVTQPTIRQKNIRLKELNTWDKPRPDNQLEHAAKRLALIRLGAV